MYFWLEKNLYIKWFFFFTYLIYPKNNFTHPDLNFAPPSPNHILITYQPNSKSKNNTYQPISGPNNNTNHISLSLSLSLSLSHESHLIYLLYLIISISQNLLIKKKKWVSMCKLSVYLFISNLYYICVSKCLIYALLLLLLLLLLL